MKFFLKMFNFYISLIFVKLCLNDKFFFLDVLILIVGDLNGDISVVRFMKVRVLLYVNEL